jgi:hypothetical protein
VLLSRYAHIIDDVRTSGVDPHGEDPRLSLDNLFWMTSETLKNIETWPPDKINRWLGFIQGCFAMRGHIDVDQERDISRPLFHQIYEEEGRCPPSSSERI